MSLLLGVNAYAATGEAGRRQAEALATWRELRGVRLANLQWPGDVFEVDGFATYPVLREDSWGVAKRKVGARKPVMAELFDRLAEIASAEGCRWFGYANSDVQVTQAAVDRVVDGGREAYAFSRMDFDRDTGAEPGIETAGVDLVVVAVDWWRANRRRFRAYIAGEPVWDNVYTAILLAHSDGILLNREPLIRHERHPVAHGPSSPYAPYVWWLAALDRPYFSLWARYHHDLGELRARGASEDEEMALRREVFRADWTASERLLHLARVAKARVRYTLARARA
ncbi:MAG TPA: hypothetical protein VFQ39_09275 [Longimicrobium sp.]|nr:hypothetical protein [Longimicrobium sp.]